MMTNWLWLVMITFYHPGKSSVFYYKMKGNNYYYLANFTSCNKSKEASNQSLETYKTIKIIFETKA